MIWLLVVEGLGCKARTLVYDQYMRRFIGSFPDLNGVKFSSYIKRCARPPGQCLRTIVT